LQVVEAVDVLILPGVVVLLVAVLVGLELHLEFL
jgi:hypothetical protein